MTLQNTADKLSIQAKSVNWLFKSYKNEVEIPKHSYKSAEIRY